MAKTQRSSILPYQIVIGVTNAAIGGIVAVLGELRDELGVDATSIGLIVAAGFLASFVSQITLAPFADRGYGRQMAIAGVVLSSLGLVVMIFADSVGLWIAARAALGFSGGLLLPGIRRAATVLDPERAGENLGRLVIGEVAGFTLGPAIAAGFVEFGGVRAPFVASAIGMALFVPFVVRLPDDTGKQTTTTRNSVELLRIRSLQGALILIFGYFMLIGAFEAVVPLMFQDRGGGATEVGLSFLLLGLPIAFVSTHAGKLADRVGGGRVAIAGMAVSAAAAFLYGFVPGIFWLVVTMMVIGFADGYGFTAGQVAVSQAVTEDRQAGALGLMGAAEVLGAGLAALPAAALYDAGGARATWTAASSASLIVLALGAWRILGAQPATGAGTPLERSD